MYFALFASTLTALWVYASKPSTESMSTVNFCLQWKSQVFSIWLVTEDPDSGGKYIQFHNFSVFCPTIFRDKTFEKT